MDPTKVHLVKAMVFPVVLYGYESCAIKKAEHQRIDAFELWCWRRLSEVPWRARRSKQSTLKEINLNSHWKDWCWSFNTLATWCKELTHWKRLWCWERLRAGREGGNKGWGHHWLNGHEFEHTPDLSNLSKDSGGKKKQSQQTWPNLTNIYWPTLFYRHCQHWWVVAFEHNEFRSSELAVVERKAVCLAVTCHLLPGMQSSICHNVLWEVEQESLRKMFYSCLDDRKHFSLLVAWW